MTTPVLYDYWRSSASYRVRIALNLKEIAYEARSVDLLSGAHKSPEHLARNPQGLVPVLEIDGRPIGSGGVGAMTRRLQGLFRERTASEGEPLPF